MKSVREATVQLIREHGARQLTATGIAERTGISIGSFYQYYPNTEAVLTDIYEQILDELNQEIVERIENQDSGFNQTFEEAINDGIAVTFSLHRRMLAVDPSFYVCFLNQFNVIDARGPDDSTWDDWAVGWLSELLNNNRDCLRHTDIPFIARFMVDVISGAVQRFAAERPEALSDEKVMREMSDLICRYVLD